jgi:hypothetical protein
MRSLYINPLLPNITLSILKNGEKISEKILPRWDDFADFPDTVIDIVDTHGIDEIWCLLWPGAFTRMRIVTLTLSTLVMTRGTIVKWCHFFDIIDAANPIIIANNSEYIIRKADRSTSLINKSTLPDGTYTGYGVQNDFTDEKILIEYSEDWGKILYIFEKLAPEKTLTPIYLKEPHITWSTKNTSPSSAKTNI